MLPEIKSYLSGEAWPAFPNLRGAQMLAMQFQLEKSQFLPPSEILENQFLQLNEIFKHSIRTVPYYKRKFKAFGLKRNKRVTAEMWLQLPVLKRSILQKKQMEMLSEKIPKGHGKTNIVQTSGSTGLPVKVVGTQITQFIWRACELRDHSWHKRNLLGKIVAIRHLDKGKAEFPGVSSPDWGKATTEIIRTGPAAVLNSSTDISLQAEFLMREEPDYLLSYPSNLEALARYFMQEDLHLKKLSGVRALGETVGSEVRQACRDAWGVTLTDMYSAQEVGYITLQCPENENIQHVQAENLYVEVVDDDGNLCREGEIGRVLLTTLHNFAMPLIRYEIGDYAQVGGRCSCGRTLPVLSQILGRKRNMLKLPDGKQSWPSFGMGMWPKGLPINQFQFVQKSLDRIEARLVTGRPLKEKEEKSFISTLQEHLRYPFQIEMRYLDSIPRSKGGKFEDFISEVT